MSERLICACSPEECPANLREQRKIKVRKAARKIIRKLPDETPVGHLYWWKQEVTPRPWAKMVSELTGPERGILFRPYIAVWGNLVGRKVENITLGRIREEVKVIGTGHRKGVGPGTIEFMKKVFG